LHLSQIFFTDARTFIMFCFLSCCGARRPAFRTKTRQTGREVYL
jgi:hypothetical protein